MHKLLQVTLAGIITCSAAFADFLHAGEINQEAFDHCAPQLGETSIGERTRLDRGSKWKKWDGWTQCENFRVFTPPSTVEQIEFIIAKYRSLELSGEWDGSKQFSNATEQIPPAKPVSPI